jgi:hypothetical protein
MPSAASFLLPGDSAAPIKALLYRGEKGRIAQRAKSLEDGPEEVPASSADNLYNAD